MVLIHFNPSSRTHLEYEKLQVLYNSGVICIGILIRPISSVTIMVHVYTLKCIKVVEHSLEAIISQHEGTAIVKDIRGEIDALVKRLYPAVDAGGTKSRGRLRAGDRKSAREEVSPSAAAWGIVFFSIEEDSYT